MHRLILGSRRVIRTIGAVRMSLALAGIFGLSVLAMQATPPAQAAWLHYQRGYYLDNGWLCYGWNNGAYHCTHHWHRTASDALVSDNPAWVPNHGAVSSLTIVADHFRPVRHVPAARPAPVYHPVYHPVHHSTYTPPAVGSGQSVTGEISAVFGPYAGQALNVARCESGFNPNAYNASSGASGVFQFLRGTWATTAYAGYSPFNASANIHAAYQVFVRDGHSWREWSCQP